MDVFNTRLAQNNLLDTWHGLRNHQFKLFFRKLEQKTVFFQKVSVIDVPTDTWNGILTTLVQTLLIKVQKTKYNFFEKLFKNLLDIKIVVSTKRTLNFVNPFRKKLQNCSTWNFNQIVSGIEKLNFGSFNSTSPSFPVQRKLISMHQKYPSSTKKPARIRQQIAKNTERLFQGWSSVNSTCPPYFYYWCSFCTCLQPCFQDWSCNCTRYCLRSSAWGWAWGYNCALHCLSS